MNFGGGCGFDFLLRCTFALDPSGFGVSTESPLGWDSWVGNRACKRVITPMNGIKYEELAIRELVLLLPGRWCGCGDEGKSFVL